MYHFPFLLKIYEGSNLTASPPTLVFVCHPDYVHPTFCKVVAHTIVKCISLMAHDVEHLFMCLLAIHLSFSVKRLFKSQALFYIGAYSTGQNECHPNRAHGLIVRTQTMKHITTSHYGYEEMQSNAMSIGSTQSGVGVIF